MQSIDFNIFAEVATDMVKKLSAVFGCCRRRTEKPIQGYECRTCRHSGIVEAIQVRDAEGRLAEGMLMECRQSGYGIATRCERDADEIRTRNGDGSCRDIPYSEL